MVDYVESEGYINDYGRIVEREVFTVGDIGTAADNQNKYTVVTVVQDGGIRIIYYEAGDPTERSVDFDVETFRIIAHGQLWWNPQMYRNDYSAEYDEDFEEAPKEVVNDENTKSWAEFYGSITTEFFTRGKMENLIKNYQTITNGRTTAIAE